MSQQALHRLLRNSLSIPTIPDTVRRINALMDDPDVGTAEIGAVVAEDAPLAAKVLRIANSAYYGLQGECVSTEQASTILGLRVLRSIVTQAAVIDEFEHLSDNEGFSFSELWQHSIHVGHVCKALAERSRVVTKPSPDELYVCGLVHDIGKVVMIDQIGARYLAVLRRARRDGQPLHLLEREEFEFGHTDVGALIAARWDLPEDVAAAIQYHHGPREMVGKSPVVSLVAHANLLIHRLENEGDVEDDEAALGVFDSVVLDQLGLERADAEAVLARTREKWRIE